MRWMGKFVGAALGFAAYRNPLGALLGELSSDESSEPLSSLDALLGLEELSSLPSSDEALLSSEPSSAGALASELPSEPSSDDALLLSELPSELPSSAELSVPLLPSSALPSVLPSVLPSSPEPSDEPTSPLPSSIGGGGSTGNLCPFLHCCLFLAMGQPAAHGFFLHLAPATMPEARAQQTTFLPWHTLINALFGAAHLLFVLSMQTPLWWPLAKHWAFSFGLPPGLPAGL